MVALAWVCSFWWRFAHHGGRRRQHSDIQALSIFKAIIPTNGTGIFISTLAMAVTIWLCCCSALIYSVPGRGASN